MRYNRLLIALSIASMSIMMPCSNYMGNAGICYAAGTESVTEQTDGETDNTEESEKSNDDEADTKSISLSEETVEQIKNITEETLLNNGYIKTETNISSTIDNGDIAIINDNIYIALKDNNEVNWWKLEENELVLDKNIEIDYKNFSVYHKKMDESACPIPSDLLGYIGDSLSSIELPQNYRWVNENEVMEEQGVFPYKAYYIPEDFLNQKTMQLDINVSVKPKTDGVEISSTYTVKYVPHLTFSMINIPDGWEIANPDKELEIGSNTTTAKYKFPNGLTTTKSIEVIVTKGELKVNGVMLTLVEGTKLSNDFFPKVAGGIFKWDEEGKIVTGNCTLTCTFEPEETDKYEATNNIPVIINVVPKTIVDNAPKPKSDDTPDQKDDTGTDTTDTGDDKKDTKDDKTDVPTDSKTDVSDTDKKDSDKKESVDVTSDKKDNKTDENDSKKTVNNTNTTKTNDSTKKNNNLNVDSQKTNDNKETIDVASKDNEQEKKKVDMKDIDLTKKETDNDKIELKTIDLTKNNEDKDKKATDTDAKKEIIVATETDSTEVIATNTDSEKTTTEATTEDVKEVPKEVKSDNNMLKLIVFGVVAAISVGGIFLFKYIKKKRI